MSTIRIPTLRFLALTNLALIHPASLIYLPICIMFSKFHTTPYLRTNVRRILFYRLPYYMYSSLFTCPPCQNPFVDHFRHRMTC